MIRRLKEFGGFFIYVLSALSALLLASWLSSLFMTKAISQTPPPPPTVQAPLPVSSDPSTPSAPPPTANVPPNMPAPGGTTAGAPLPSAPIPAVIRNKENPLADIIEDYNYVSKDKRDPFMPFERPQSVAGMVGPLWPLQGFDLDQLKLVGIIWDVRNPKAMITDPTGKGYVVRVNERIGRSNGYIARIREGEIVVVESVTGLDGKMSYLTKLMKLQTE